MGNPCSTSKHRFRRSKKPFRTVPSEAHSYAAILAAGGRGTRFAASSDTGNGGLPKQFMQLRGSPIYVWSLTTLLAVPAIASAVMVVPAEMVQDVRRTVDELAAVYPNKALRVVPGGDTRQASVFEGLKILEAEAPEFVLIHDAARPFLTRDIIDRVIEGVTTFGACTTGMPPSDTIKKVEGDVVAETLRRDELLLVQTPQAGRFSWLLAAHESAKRSGIATTDDAAILESAGHEVGIVRGASYNVKITQPEDLILAEALAAIVFADRL
jgi:2-C-methyl-D-erythritol 4-phosphate cytidylyltransferase